MNNGLTRGQEAKRYRYIAKKVLNKWINDRKEKAKFTPVARRGRWKDIFTYLYKTVVKIRQIVQLTSSVAKGVRLY